METEVAEPLFIRLHRGVAPTPRAHALARELAPHLDAVDDIVQTMASPRDVAGLVRIGAPPDLLAVKVLPALVPLLDLGLRLHGRPGTDANLLASLRARRLDLIVLPGRQSSGDLTQAPLFDEELVLVAAPSWARRIGLGAVAAAGPAALIGVPLVAYSEELPIIRLYFEQVFGEPSTGRAALVVRDLRAVAESVAAGAGVSVLPRYHLTDKLARGDLVELHRPVRPPTNTVYHTHRRGPLDPPTALVATALQRAAPQWEHR